MTDAAQSLVTDPPSKARRPITDRESKKYTDIWGFDEYHEMSPGAQMVDFFLRATGAQPGDSILDVGAGAGAASRIFKDKGFKVSAFDLTSEAWEHDDISLTVGSVWRDLKSCYADYIYCVDMGEHLPEQFVALSLKAMIEHSERVFLSVSTVPDGMGALIGEALHLTVKPFIWWRDTLRELGTVYDARDLINSAVFVVGR